MSIADWFRPKWKHSDPAVRRTYVEGLTEQHGEGGLAWIAKDDPDSGVRNAALERVSGRVFWPTSQRTPRTPTRVSTR